MTRLPESTSLSAPVVHTLQADVCIVGAGVTGAALGAMLGRNGLSVVVVEKELRTTEKIVGELLQPEGVRQLQRMGLGHCLENIDAQLINGYHLTDGQHSCSIPYPDASLRGRAFHHHLFIDKLRDELKKCPQVQLLPAKATDCREENGRVCGVAAENSSGQKWIIYSRFTLLCDGLHSGFRTRYHQDQPQHTGFFLGLILRNCPLPSPGHGHVFLTESSPFLCYPISSGDVRMLIDFRESVAPRKGSEEVLARYAEVEKQLPASMIPAFQEAIAGSYFKVMPNYRLTASGFRYRPGLAILGDALNMRHPLTGGGMTAGLSDACRLGEVILASYLPQTQSTASTDHYLATHFYSKDHRKNDPINILADALYGVFRHPDLSRACLAYLQSPGFRSSGPVRLLAGISRSRLLLFFHFFAVALYGAFRPVSGLGITRRIQMIQDAWQILFPLVRRT